MPYFCEDLLKHGRVIEAGSNIKRGKEEERNCGPPGQHPPGEPKRERKSGSIVSRKILVVYERKEKE